MGTSNIDFFLLEYFADINIPAGAPTIQNGTKQNISQNQYLQATVNHLSDTITHMQQQMKSLQSLQFITIFVFVMLAIAIVYILKMEIQNQNSQYCIDK